MGMITYRDFLDYKICDESYENVVEEIKENIDLDNQKVVLAFNPKKFVLAQKDDNVKKALLDADILIPDGYGIIMGSKILGNNIHNRITGTDLANRLFVDEEVKKTGFFIYGATEESVSKAVEIMKKRNINVVGYANGYDYDDSFIIKKINESKSKVLLVALGSPKQELFIYKYKKDLKYLNLIMGVGGTVDVISGYAKRAPVFFQKLGLEWLFRMVCNPNRFDENKENIITYIKEIIAIKRGKK